MGLLRHLFKPLDRAAFAREVVGSLERQGKGSDLQVDLEEFVVRYGDKRSFYLGNLYEEYLRVGAFKRSGVFDFVLRQAAGTAPPVPDSFVNARLHLMPSVRDPLTFDLQRLMLPLRTAPDAPTGKYDPAWLPLGDDYCVSVVFDGATTMSYLNKEQFQAWDVPFERALEYALDNLAQRPFSVEPLRAGFYRFDTRDSYDAARLLLKDRVRALALRGRPVAAIPNRECLLVTGEDDREGLAALAAAAEEGYDHPRAIGISPLLLDGEAWRAFRPSGADALSVQLSNLSVRNLGSRYADQLRVLEKLHEKSGDDVLVAKFSGLSATEGGAIHTCCLWSPGIPTLLPKTELVTFAGEGRDEALFPWDAVVAEAGALMKPQGLVPERWLVTGFPAAEAFARLAPTAVKV
jgi:hypothetical protein